MKHAMAYRLLVCAIVFWAVSFAGQTAPAAAENPLEAVEDGRGRLSVPDPGNRPSASEAMDGKIGKQSGIGRLFGAAMRASGAAAMKISDLFSDMTGKERYWQGKLYRLTEGKGGRYLMGLLLQLVLIVTASLGMEWLLKRSTEDIRTQIVNTMPSGVLHRIGRVLSHLLLNAAGVFAYVVFSFLLLFVICGRQLQSIFIVSPFIVSSYYFRIFLLAADTMLAPAAPALRFFPLQDADARFLYRWIVRISLAATFFAAFSSLFQLALNDAELALLSYSAAGISVTVLIVGMIWQSRRKIADVIRSGAPKGEAPSALRDLLARKWHRFAIAYVAVIGLYWLAGVLIRGTGELPRLMLSIFLIPVFIGLDQWGQRLVDIVYERHGPPDSHTGHASDADKKMPPAEESSGAESATEGSTVVDFLPKIKSIYRGVLVAFLFFTVLGLWGIDLPIGRFFTSTALSIMVALLLGFLAWEYARVLIDRKIKEEMPDADEDMEEGGSGGSRKGTLLVLLRKFILSVLFVVVALIILSAIGVEIGPLIASAGVVGLAIGFGAQTLVKDIISGVFFLIDDAFRVGDYVETAGVKGMVEQISLRSMRLRHPRGMVHTIPFGDMGTVTNFSRDYIISKLDFRVRYDTDVEKVRKIIKKKVYKPILADESLGPKLLGKIKSQGVRELDDSAMIMRVKFKTPPGEQFVLRREVFRRMQEAFRKEGIEFAHRNVTVYLPPDQEQHPQDASHTAGQRMIEAGAAAALAAEQGEPTGDGQDKEK